MHLVWILLLRLTILYILQYWILALDEKSNSSPNSSSYSSSNANDVTFCHHDLIPIIMEWIRACKFSLVRASQMTIDRSNFETKNV